MSFRHRPFVALLLAVALAGGCRSSTTTGPAKGSGVSARATQTMSLVFFGLGLPQPGHVLSDESWRRFADEEIALRFPDGFTVLRADGAWRDAVGTYREPSHVLLIIHDGTAEASRRIDELRDLYKRRFEQEAVLRIDAPLGRVSF